MSKKISDLRKDYQKGTLDIHQISNHPIQQFREWWKEALNSQVLEANAVFLATVNDKGQPSLRTVLLKGIQEDGFIFYTNYQSKKAQEIAKNNNVSLLFLWKELERQVRIEGIAQKVNPHISDEYFHSRPEGSRIGAWSSPQSQIIKNREALEKIVQQHESNFKDKNIPRPPFWGGYIVIPQYIEFWQGRSSRLHDRIAYTLKNDTWTKERLAP